MAILIDLEKDGRIKKAPVGFSWTVFFFGMLVPIFRGDFKWFIVMFIAAVVTLDLSQLVFCFLYNRVYLNDLLDSGWKPIYDKDIAILKEKGILKK